MFKIILNFWSSQCSRLLRPCTKWRGQKKIKTTSFHQYSWNSKVEKTWISLIGWHQKTSNKYALLNIFSSFFCFRPDYGDTLSTFLCKHLLSFPPWLKIVCSVRTGLQDITKMLPFQRLSLDKTDVDERLNKDMSDYLNLRINR